MSKQQTTTSEFMTNYEKAKKHQQMEASKGVDDLNKEVERIMKGSSPASPKMATNKTARLLHALANGKYGKNKQFKKQLSLVVAQQVKDKDMSYIYSQDPQLESIITDADKLLKQYDIQIQSPSQSKRDRSGQNSPSALYKPVIGKNALSPLNSSKLAKGSKLDDKINQLTQQYGSALTSHAKPSPQISASPSAPKIPSPSNKQSSALKAPTQSGGKGQADSPYTQFFGMKKMIPPFTGMGRESNLKNDTNGSKMSMKRNSSSALYQNPKKTSPERKHVQTEDSVHSREDYLDRELKKAEDQMKQEPLAPSLSTQRLKKSKVLSPTMNTQYIQRKNNLISNLEKQKHSKATKEVQPTKKGSGKEESTKQIRTSLMQQAGKEIFGGAGSSTQHEKTTYGTLASSTANGVGALASTPSASGADQQQYLSGLSQIVRSQKPLLDQKSGVSSKTNESKKNLKFEDKQFAISAGRSSQVDSTLVTAENADSFQQKKFEDEFNKYFETKSKIRNHNSNFASKVPSSQPQGPQSTQPSQKSQPSQLSVAEGGGSPSALQRQTQAQKNLELYKIKSPYGKPQLKAFKQPNVSPLKGNTSASRADKEASRSNLPPVRQPPAQQTQSNKENRYAIATSRPSGIQTVAAAQQDKRRSEGQSTTQREDILKNSSYAQKIDKELKNIEKQQAKLQKNNGIISNTHYPGKKSRETSQEPSGRIKDSGSNIIAGPQASLTEPSSIQTSKPGAVKPNFGSKTVAVHEIKDIPHFKMEQSRQNAIRQTTIAACATTDEDTNGGITIISQATTSKQGSTPLAEPIAISKTPTAAASKTPAEDSLAYQPVQFSQENLNRQIQAQLADDEIKMFGAYTRCIRGYKKIEILGKGGCAIVWLCQDLNTNRQVACKQFPKSAMNQMNYQSGLAEIQFCNLFYNIDGQPFPQYRDLPGLNSVCRLLDHQEDKQDLWLVFELCGQPLTKVLFSTKGQFYRGERIYEVTQNERTYELLEADGCKEFKKIIRCILEGLLLLKQAGVVHCDLKSENILVDIDYERKIVRSVKIIDFGTSFLFDAINQKISLTTPEYLPPEILEFIEFKQLNAMGAAYSDSLKDKLNIKKRLWQWSLDIWSLGVILLEMVVGFPVWMSYKGRIVRGEQSDLASPLMTGIFGVQGRMPQKIAKIQLQCATSWKQALTKGTFLKELCLGGLNHDTNFIQFLSLLLHTSPRLRKSPDVLLKSNFLNE